jgi:hypothetical protein
MSYILNTKTCHSGLHTHQELMKWNSKPSVDEITKFTSDPQMSITILKDSCVTRGATMYWLEKIES